MEKGTPIKYTFHTGGEDEITIEWIPEKGKMPPFELDEALSRYADDICWILEKTKDMDGLESVICCFKGLNKVLSTIIEENYGYTTPKDISFPTYYTILKESGLDMDQFRSLEDYIHALIKVIDDSRKMPFLDSNMWRKTIKGFYPGEIILHRLWWLLDIEVRRLYHKLDLLDCVPADVDIKVGFRSDDMMTATERAKNKNHKQLPKDENGRVTIPSEEVMELRFLGSYIEAWYGDCENRIFKYEPKRQLAELKKIRESILNLKNKDGLLYIGDYKDIDYVIFATGKRNYYSRLKEECNSVAGVLLDIYNQDLSWEDPVPEAIAHNTPFAIFALFFFWGGLNYEIDELERITSNDSLYDTDAEKQPGIYVEGNNNGIAANNVTVKIPISESPALSNLLLQALTQPGSISDSNK